MKFITCPQCKNQSYDPFQGCNTCGAKCGWPATNPTPYQLRKFEKHGLVIVGGSSLAAKLATNVVYDGRSLFDTGYDMPQLLENAFNSGSAVSNLSPGGFPRTNKIFAHSGRVGVRYESSGSSAQSGIRLAQYDRPGRVHPFPSDVPDPNDMFIP